MWDGLKPAPTRHRITCSTANTSPSLNARCFLAASAKQHAYISFYLMPIYSNPELLGKMSDDLRRRMQGKSCFNFTQLEPELFAELEQLVHAGFACYERLNYVK